VVFGWENRYSSSLGYFFGEMIGLDKIGKKERKNNTYKIIIKVFFQIIIKF
jgi:hypothetical protein